MDLELESMTRLQQLCRQAGIDIQGMTKAELISCLISIRDTTQRRHPETKELRERSRSRDYIDSQEVLDTTSACVGGDCPLCMQRLTSDEHGPFPTWPHSVLWPPDEVEAAKKRRDVKRELAVRRGEMIRNMPKRKRSRAATEIPPAG